MQQAINGIFLGSIYALFAVGYTLLFGVLDILNLAHQAVFMLCAFTALALLSGFHRLLAPFPRAHRLPSSPRAGGLDQLRPDQLAGRGDHLRVDRPADLGTRRFAL